MKNCNPLISVMVPVYKKHHEAIQCLDSIVKQTYQNLEIVISDDSPDGRLGEQIAEYFDDARIVYHHNTTRLGRVKNYQNLLYNLVKGDWYINVDGDDILSNQNFLKACVETLEDNAQLDDLALVFGDELELNETSQRITKRLNNLTTKTVFEPNELFFTNNKIGASFYHLSSLVNVNFARRANAYTDNCLGCDTLALYRTIYGNSCIYIPVVGGTWRNHGCNESFTSNPEDLESNLISVSVVNMELSKINELSNVQRSRLKSWEIRQIESRFFFFCLNIRTIWMLIKLLPEIIKIGRKSDMNRRRIGYALSKVLYFRMLNAFNN